MKTLAIRMEDDVHARLSILAKLAGLTVTDAIRAGIERQIEAMASDPALSSRASDLRAEIEREAAEQRAAIAELFGDGGTAPGRTTRSTKTATDK